VPAAAAAAAAGAGASVVGLLRGALGHVSWEIVGGEQLQQQAGSQCRLCARVLQWAGYQAFY